MKNEVLKEKRLKIRTLREATVRAPPIQRSLLEVIAKNFSEGGEQAI